MSKEVRYISDRYEIIVRYDGKTEIREVFEEIARRKLAELILQLERDIERVNRTPQDA